MVETVRQFARRLNAELVVSRDAADLTSQARRAAEEGLDRLVVAGGDGTLHHALQGLVGTSTILAPVSAGTGNDLVGELGLPKDATVGLEAAVEGPVRTLDVGRVDWQADSLGGSPGMAAEGGGDEEREANRAIDSESSAASLTPAASPSLSGRRYFVGVAGVGFDSEVANFVNRGVAGLPSSWVYPWGVVRTLTKFRPPVLRLEFDGELVEQPITLIAIANTTRFGGGMSIAPDAKADDGLFDVVTVGAVSKLTLLKVFPKVYSGSHLDHPAVQVRRVKKLRIGLDRELMLYGDGEAIAPVGPRSIELSIEARALRVASSTE